MLLDLGVLPRLVSLLGNKETTLVVPAIITIGGMLNGSYVQRAKVLDAGVFPRLVTLLNHGDADVAKEAINIIAQIISEFS